jgi:hypothetical protein
MRLHPSCGHERKAFASKSVKGGGAPIGASSSMSATHSQTLPSESASAAVARHTDKRYRLPALRARSPLSAPRAVLAAQINATAQPRPRFVRTGGYGRYPHHRTLLQRFTSRTGHSAGRSDARAAPGGVTSPARRNRPRPMSRPSPVTFLHGRVETMTFERERKVKRLLIGGYLFRWKKELRKSPAGVTSALPHSLANIRSQTREKPMFIGISGVHAAKALNRSSVPNFAKSFRIQQ